MRDLVVKAIREAEAQLRKFGIRDTFTVKMKRFTGERVGWIGLYRSRSQFQARGAIFWLNEEISTIAPAYGLTPHEAIVSTLLHEYGHVIYEYAALRAPALFEMIDTVSSDEEDFAETFAVAVGRGVRSPAYRAIAARFQRELTLG